ncbi:P-loop containing nucleoside triphosphate hydrolase protein [Caulochytrium protostelioides]|uniref:P-loop containing nucleoside triphosphate hydrolase protein n=1 Tax=Caulochytrium protostelioides TaxID=1555241 RepID=A0A4V1ITE4_9FUNG|nr:P-loop containing nucleoside triphosphate hydrolase protein [Caulochytrium protostelioides]
MTANREQLSKAQRAELKRLATPERPYVTVNPIKLFYTLVRMNDPEWRLTIAALIGSFLVGCNFPAMSVLLGILIDVLFLPVGTLEEQRHLRHEADFYALWFFVMSLVILVAQFGKYYAFGLAGERLTHRLRDQVFRATMRQNIGWFDEDAHSSGVLVSNLSNDPQSVQTLSGTLLGSIIEFTVNIVAGIAIAIGFNWRLGLITSALLPLQLYANKKRTDILMKGNQATKAYYESSAQVACEAVSAMRTVAVLTRERDVCEKYHHDLEVPLRIGTRSAVTGSIIYALTQGVNFWQNAIIFRVGGAWLYPRADGSTLGGLTLRTFFICLMSSTFAAMACGRVFSLLPDVSKALESAHDILAILRRRPKIDNYSEEGSTLDPQVVKGHIRFEDIQFRYPTRPDVKVLKGINLEVKPGQFIALVGSSGCGKSTSIQLCERFYDPSGGRVTLDGVDIREFNLRSYRSVLGLVSQEPNLYEMTIRENIALGYPIDAPPTEEQIVQAAKDANIHDFVASLPQGYDTMLANRGSGLSGGQKQRIAIARALIRQPRVLLLDEATSALSSEDEVKISKVLEQAAKGRTTISIAHRLSSIQHADRIYLFMNGRIKEQGTHSELIALGGEYYNMALQQSLA